MLLFIEEGFRFDGAYYGPTENPVEVPGEAARFAIKAGFASDVERAEAEAMAKAKTTEEAPEAKSKGAAPENK